MDDITHELFLIKKDVEVGSDVGAYPVVIVAQGIRIPGGVDASRHTTSVNLGQSKRPPDLSREVDVGLQTGKAGNSWGANPPEQSERNSRLHVPLLYYRPDDWMEKRA